MGYTNQTLESLIYWHGIKSISELSELTDTKEGTLKGWHTSSPARFKAILDGAMMAKARNDRREQDELHT